MKNKLKIVNYLGDYGPINFWQNITKSEIDIDIKFIAENKFNTIILMYPYATFKPELDSFETPYSELLNYIIKVCKNYEIDVVLRFGYLWESNFMEQRTFERYSDIYKSTIDSYKSKYLDDFVDLFHYTMKTYDILHAFISWEDFFWPVRQVAGIDLNDEILDLKNKEFIEFILSKIGHHDKLFIEQRTNGIFHPIEYSNTKLNYSYYNTFCLREHWHDQIKDDYLHIHKNMIVEKQFVEWYSRVSDLLKINKDTKNQLVIDQFNIVDNTFDDDDHHFIEDDDPKRDCMVTNKNFDEVVDFISSVGPHLLGGIGVWCLWDTEVGQSFNGTFKHGKTGYEADCEFDAENNCFNIKEGQFVSTNFGYVRLESENSVSFLLDIETNGSSELRITYNDEQRIINLNESEVVNLEFPKNIDRQFEIFVVSGEITLKRIDIFGITLKSFMYNKNRKPKKSCDASIRLLNRF